MTNTTHNQGHTPEPWITHEESGVLGQDKILITSKGRLDEHIIEIGEISVGFDAPFDAEQIANARRIVACVNAFKGIGIELVETAALIGVNKMMDFEAEQKADTLRTRCGELEAALKQVRLSIEAAVRLSAVYNGHTYDFSNTVKKIDSALSSEAE